MRAADLGEAGGAGLGGHGALVREVAVAVHQDDGRAAQAVGPGGPQPLGHRFPVQGCHDATVGVDPFGDLDHPVVHRFGQQNAAVEEPRSVLVRDAQGVPEAFRDDQDGRLAAPLQQGVGGDRRTDLHRADPVGGDRVGRAETQQPRIPATAASR